MSRSFSFFTSCFSSCFYSCGIFHRDVKPENILIKVSCVIITLCFNSDQNKYKYFIHV